jgi:hypothetical protein
VLNEAARFHSVSDVALLMRARQWSKGDAIQHLRDQGYDQDVAETELAIEDIKLIAAFERELANVAVDAFAAGRIDESTLGEYTDAAMLSTQQNAQLRELAHARRALRATPLSPAEAEACVKAGILSVVDYRDALRQAGRSPDAIDALELLLRYELDKGKRSSSSAPSKPRKRRRRRSNTRPTSRSARPTWRRSKHWRAAARSPT